MFMPVKPPKQSDVNKVL